MRSLAFSEARMFSALADWICVVLKPEDAAAAAAVLCCLLAGAAPWWQTETSGVASFPLMSKRTTSMLITTKCSKFWLIIRALCDGSDELSLSAFLKTVHQNSCKLWVGARVRRARPYGWYYCNSAQFMTSTSDKRNETHPYGGRCPLTKTAEQNIGGCVWRARGTDVLLPALALHVQSFSVLTLRRHREQFCVRSQESLLNSVPKGWAETGKKLVRTSAVSLPSTRQKRLRHGGDGAVGGCESRYRRMNLLTHVGTSCLFLSVCLWLFSRGIKHIVIGLSRAVWKIRRMKHLFGTSWCTLRAGLNMV